MSYSAHRPGRLDSQGQIAFGVDESRDLQSEEEPFEFVREFVPDAPPQPFEPAAQTTDFPEAPSAPPVPEAAPSAAEPQRPALHTHELRNTDEPEPQTFDEILYGRRQRWWRRSRKNQATSPQQVPEPKTPAPVIPSPEHPQVARQAPRRAEAREQLKAVAAPAAPRGPRSKLRTLAILGGADGHILDRVPQETPRFVQMFFVLAGTALVSALSMLFALTTGVRAAVWLAIPLAIVWGLIIFNLDRFLTSTMGATRKVGKLIGLALPRVAMAVLIGVIVAEPVVLQVFHNDIAREVQATNIAQAQADQESLQTGPEKIALDAASERLAALENQAATGIVAGTDASSASQSAAQTRVDELTAKLAEQQSVIDQARALYQCELTGDGAGEVAGCTGVSGEGASSTAARDQLAAAQQTYDALATQLREANDERASADASAREATTSSESQNREQAQSQLPAAQATYDQALTAYNARVDAVANGNADAVGLLSQITGLNSLAAKEPAIGWAHWMIAALFFMIELLPVLVKVLTSYGDPSLYERTALARKQVDGDRISSEAFRERAEIIASQSAAVDTQVAR